MKKFLAIILALMMVFSLCACTDEGAENTGGGGTPTATQPGTPNTTEPDPTEEPLPPATAAPAEPLDYTPLLHLDFESTDGLTAKTQIMNMTTWAIAGLCDSYHPITLTEDGQGAAGKALYLDGKYGVNFDIPRIDDDSYTISFWFNAEAPAQFGPVVQMGRNIDGSVEGEPVTWMNFTKVNANTWPINTEDIFPLVWNRNSSIGTEVSADGVWPWIYAMDNQTHGIKEWCMVTIVVNGTRYVADDGMDRIETKLYLNGAEVWDANTENMFYQGISPEIFKGDHREGLIGINYWDIMYKGFIDELYIFDEALTAGQVTTLFEKGNPPATPTAPATPDYTENEEAKYTPEPVVDEPGTMTVEGFFTKKSDFTALKNGETLTYTFKNTAKGNDNWSNYIMAVVTAEGEAYTGAEKEVAIIRADAWGWGGGASDFVDPNGEGNKLTFENNVNWDEWQTKMKAGVDVKITIGLNGNTLTYNATIGEYTVSLTATSGVDLPDTLYVFLTGQDCVLSGINVA